jgi:acetoin utilization protein AcuC
MLAAAALPALGAAARFGAAAVTSRTCLYHGQALGRYGFPQGHPLGVDRQGAFMQEAVRQGLDAKAVSRPPQVATRDQIERFHTRAHVERVLHAERDGLQLLDNGDTPVFPGMSAACITRAASPPPGSACSTTLAW